MSGQHIIDPALSAPSSSANIQSASAPPLPPPPLPRFEPQYAQQQQQHQQQQQQHQQPPNSNVGVYPQHSPGSSNPYYGFPATQTPTPLPQSTGAPSIASGSNQTSPQGATPQYQQLAQDGIDNSHVSDGNDTPGEGGGGGGDDSKRPRACEACRGLKVRCDQDPAHPELPCRRCAKAGRQCLITAPSRKRQKKADSRVAELEKKLDHLTAVLQQQHHHHQQGGPIQYGLQYGLAPTADMQGRAYAQAAQQLQQYNQTAEQAHDPSSMQPPAKRRRVDDDAQEPPTPDVKSEPAGRYAARSNSEVDLSQRFDELNSDFAPHARLSHNLPQDFADRINALVDPPLGAQIFNCYIEKLAPHMPAVVFAPGTEAEQIWKEKPILYASILSAASYGILPAEVTRELTVEAVKAIADAVVVNGAKSVELIQAMQVLALWYKPPEEAQQTNFYQIIHMAAVMAMDIGLGKRFNSAQARRGFGAAHPDSAPGSQRTKPSINSDSLESRRAWLGCYYLCASASMVLRRPNLVHWTKYMEECVQILETSPEAPASDKLFCQHIKIQHICEDVSVQFSMDDNTASISITDPKVTYALNVLETDLKDWIQKVPPELKTNPSLRFFEHVASLYLHEIALHFNHNVEDFRLPFTEESLKSVNNTSEKLTQNQIAALEACRHAAHGVLDGMLRFDPDMIKTLPMLLFFVRCTYALVVLIKMHVAVTTPGSEMSKMMTAEDIDVDRYINGLIDMFANVPTEQEYRPHPKILRILSILRDWFTKHKENVATQARGDAGPNPVQQQQSDQSGQTPLHLLAQTATDVNKEQIGQAPGDGQNWNFNTPFPADYSQQSQPQPQPHPNQPDGQFPINQHNPQNNYQQGGASYGGNGGEFDANNPWLWGSNFQQAMDLNMADMTGVTGGGMDGMFLGSGLAPFDFNAETFQ